MTMPEGNRGRGRPVGSKNRAPSKSAAAREQMSAYVAARVEQYLETLNEIAFDATNKPHERIAAIKELLDRGTGRPVSTVALIDAADAAGDPETAASLLGLWDTTDAAPTVEE